MTADCRQFTFQYLIAILYPHVGRTIRPLLTIPEQFTGRLRSELLCGRLQPGEPLREVPLATRYGVSRATVRQAFGQLVQEGLLVARRNCGVRVATPPSDAVRELLMPMRVMAETYALRNCLARLTPDDFREWERLLARLEASCLDANYAAVIECDFDFHRHLMVRGGLGDLLSLWTTLITKTATFYEHEKLNLRMLPAVHLMHVELLALFRVGDEPAAVRALAEHILNGGFNEQVRQRWAAKNRKRMRHSSSTPFSSFPSPRSS